MELSMYREIRVAIVEDDPYARDLMALLMWRDWRTRVVGEVGHPQEIHHVLGEESPDLLLLGADNPDRVNQLAEAIQAAQVETGELKVLCVATLPDRTALERCLAAQFHGYLLRSEIAYALVWAVSLARTGQWVITPSILNLIDPFPVRAVAIRDLPGFPGLTRQEAETARLGILFNLPRRSLAHEKVKTPDTIYEYVSKAYDKLAMIDVLSTESSIDDFFVDRPDLLKYFGPDLEYIWEMARAYRGKKGFGEKETCAFHLLTIPEIIFASE
jgi:DNA-binding NarL/FixJ family response regulator